LLLEAFASFLVWKMGGYENIERGPLRLKTGISKKKKKKGKVEEQETPKVAVGKTEAEKRFEEKKRQREEQRLKEEAQLSYRSKIEKFNEQLREEPEHFDVPKVCPTK